MLDCLAARLFKHHIFNLHKAYCRASLIFVELHRNVFYGFLILGYHNMLKRIYSASCLFDFGRHKLARLFDLGKTQHIRHYIRQRFYRRIKVGRRKRKAVRIYIVFIGGFKLGIKNGKHYAHHVFFADVKAHFLRRHHKSNIKGGVAHNRARQSHMPVRLLYALLHLAAQFLVFSYKVEETAHQLILLVF